MLQDCLQVIDCLGNSFLDEKCSTLMVIIVVVAHVLKKNGYNVIIHLKQIV